MARKMKIETNYENGTNTFTLVDSDGEPLGNFESFVQNINDYPTAIVTRVTLHGGKQILADSYAGVAEPEAILAGMQTRHAAMVAGDWSARTGDGAVRLTLLATDVMAATGQDQPTVVAWLADMSKADKKAVHDSDTVTEARLAREKAATIAAEKALKAKVKDGGDDDESAVDVFAGLG